jgi:two-component system, OmpR family, sensor histidine kinase KdpD
MKRGHLRVYLGAAAGVGKTFAMLDEGQRRRARGTEVVIGFVETHGRPRTTEHIGDLPVIPRKKIDYRGTTFEEMDVDAILRRKPDVVLVDELAHTNVPGSPNEKRWQDVEELLAADITVITTVNIQHLESLNDVIENITGVKQRETIPDEIVRNADQIELVDISPWSLRRRMVHGNIYPPEKIDTALTNYFREENLTALREMALLWLADRVDEALLRYRQMLSVDQTWEARERVIVAVAGRPDEDAMVRRAARIAARRGGELLVVHILTQEGLQSDAGPELANLRELAQSLGASFYETPGSDVARELIAYAKRENATQIVIGASQRSRWSELFRGSAVRRLIRVAGPVDVLVVSGDRQSAVERLRALAPKTRRPSGGLSPGRRLLGLGLTAAGLPLLTLGLANLRHHLGLSSDLLLYLLFVIVVAIAGGWWPALIAAVGASLLANWFFTPPFYTFTIAELQNVLALVVFVVVAGAVSWVVDVAARRGTEAGRSRAEAEALARLAGALALEQDPLPALVNNLRNTFRFEGVAVYVKEHDEWIQEASAGPIQPGPQGGTDEFAIREDAKLVVVGQRLSRADHRVIDAFVAGLGGALAARRLQKEAAAATEAAEVSELRGAILQAVSHDLRTPLSSIKAAVSSLRQSDVMWSPAEVKEFLETIETESDRLNSVIGNLLDMSRLQAKALRLVMRPLGLEEIVPRALEGIRDKKRPMDLDIPEGLPRVLADPTLLERAIANIIDNANTWSPSEQPVRVFASVVGDYVELRVVDHGAGIPASERANAFLPFQRRGDVGARSGLGLGLAVAKGFVEAMKGKLELDDTPGGGLTVVVRLPAAR